RRRRKQTAFLIMSKNAFKIKFLFFFFVFCLPSLASAGDVVINEIAWMGNDVSSSDEWIEFYNNSNLPVDIKDWSIYGADTEKCLNFSDADGNITTIIPTYEYLIYSNHEDDIKDTNGINAVDIWDASIGMNNTSPGQIILYDTPNCQGNMIDIINQTDIWLEGNSGTKQTMERISDGWQTSLSPGGTPKIANSEGAEEISEIGTVPAISVGAAPESGAAPISNQPPVANAGMDMTALVGQEILFDGSLSSDPDNDELSYFWNFGDGATDTEQLSKHTYLYPGQYIASLLVNDGEFSDLALVSINIYNQSVIISEFMPAPEEGDAENEWIELFNQSDQIANLTNWQLDDQEGGSSPFVFPANSFIAPNQFLVLIRPITKIALNNDNDQVRLIYPDGSLAAEVGYLAEKKEGFSIAFDGSEYFWTKTPTPGLPNIITSNNLNAKEENLSANNPDPIAQQAQNTPENIVAVNLNQSESFSALNAPAENVGSIENKKTVTPQNQTAAIAQSAQPNQKSKLILIISIIISAALLTSWGLIMLSKRRA
ncbi:lamin tail domain-containing protein, partial [Patescibacteria group bacterium]|nr:lamin tail domain-containing protein [Patescibacteria group bacterium]